MFLRFNLGLIVLLAASNLLSYDTGQLKGTVTDSAGAVIHRARVLVHWDTSGASVGLKSNVGTDHDVIVETDKNGSFKIDLPPGFYDVFVTSDAFSPDCRKFRIKADEITTYYPKLKLAPLVIDEIGDRFLPK